MKPIAQAIVAVSLTVVGMAGLYFKIEYSGWVLAIGLIGAFGLL